MGAPVDTGLENFEEAILKLPIAERTKLAHWILESIVEEAEPPVEGDKAEVEPAPESNSVWPPANLRIADSERLSGKKPWFGELDLNRKRTPEERAAAANAAWGAWADWAPDDLAEQLIASRSISSPSNSATHE